jgi:ATP-binding cassette, subfamily G (WHITE), eye pigment precursor transporter
MKSESIPVTLEWRSIELNVQTAAGPKAILRGLTGHASPGDLVGIMGPSGAGKTSLLNVLAQRTPGAPGGQVLLNGEPWRENYLSILAYMPQDEMFLAELTPREHLTFMAQLRMHGRETAEQAQRVEQVLREMKLTGVANSLIGAPQADGGLSRNERKRLNFATETLTEPSLLYVDEPTTGLDSVMAKNVVEQLKLMASGSAEHPAKRTVLATIHQPSAEIFKLFDKLYFIVDGRLAYFGPTAAVPAYFSAMGYDMPPTAASVPDFVMELCVDPSHRSAAAVRRKELCEKFMTAEVPAPRSAASDAALAQVDAVAAAPTSTQFGILMARDLLMRRRTPILTKAIIVRNGVLATLLGLLLLRLDMSQTYVYSLTGSIFFGVASCVMPTSIGHISTLPFQLPVVIREVRANSYSVKAYFAAKFLGDIPVDFIGCTLFATLLNFLTGMAHDDPVVWLKCVGIFFCATLIGNAIGQWGAIVAPSDNPFVGLIFVLLLVIPQFLFCGVMILIDQIPVWWRWMAEVSVFRYFLELAMSAQVNCRSRAR